MRIQSIKFKITILYTIALGTLLVAYSSYLYLTLSRGLGEDLDIELKTKTKQIKYFIEEFNRQTFQPGENIDKNFDDAIDMTINLDEYRSRELTLKATNNDWLKSFDHLDLSEDYIYFLNVDSNVPAFTKNVNGEIKAVFLNTVDKNNSMQRILKNIRLNNEYFRLIQEPVYFNGKLKFIILIATSQKTLVMVLKERRDILFFSIPFVLVLAILISKYFSDRLVKPIVEVASVAEQVTHKDLSQRIKTRYNDEEIKIMVAAFNKMIDRLQKAFGHIAEFNSHVAHELKTPIAIINGECEVALRKEQSNNEYKETLKAVFEESKKMLKITEDLLLLAKADYVPENFVFEEFDLNEFFEEICGKERKIALEKEIDIKLKVLTKIRTLKGDALHLRRLFLNIINNAIKFTSKGGVINLTVKADQNNLIVEISDTGIGISSEDINKIFDQFYQKVPTD
ncbi:MAG: HAMP domain-containing histidine kinase, partial [Candidatus Omnitrophica bacterium]|nr:HAMP domain-containing histidine kinase [Candidatus Omnitrophota bacterium]